MIAHDSKIQTHFLPTYVATGHHCFAQLAAHPRGQAIVFLHGFGGEARRTWQQFPRLMTLCEEFYGVDFYYYGYRSIGKGVIKLANAFRSFVEYVFDVNPTRSVLET